MGLILGLLSFLYAIIVLIARITGQIQVEGFTALMLVFLLVSSFQMIAIGVIGEYLWRNLEASRKRPPYVVDEII
jgi:dolichol-phosphate mannosyltransferase